MSDATDPLPAVLDHLDEFARRMAELAAQTPSSVEASFQRQLFNEARSLREGAAALLRGGA
jgi:hypothetical protein